MNRINKFAFLTLLPVSVFAMPHIKETMVLEKGWNAVYIESTPTNALCEDFFRDAPVLGASVYMSDADSSTAQYDSTGNEIVQAPVSFLQWIRGENVSTLGAISGGNTMIIYATEAWTNTFYGVPRAPKVMWRKISSSETNELFNIVGVSSASKKVSIEKYFAEGPFGASSPNRGIYSICGTNENASPDLKNAEKASFGKTATLVGGRAYALTATSAGDWPGVIGVQGDGVFFYPDANYASIKVKNCGNKKHTFRFSMVESATEETLPPIARRMPRVDAISTPAYTNVEVNVAWDVSLEADEVVEQIFKLERSQIVANRQYGAILTIEDLNDSLMRVRLPIAVAAVSEKTVVYPAGLWVGEIALSQVSGIDDVTPTPVTAGGTLKMNVMVHVDTNGTCRLLQRVAAGVDTNGTARLFKELSSVPTEIENPTRISTVMMSVDTPVVTAVDGAKFGDDAVFSWTIDPKARDNPFRHAWHPDHDGKTADYKGDAPSGDNFANYSNPIKPELWSISNRFELSWHENGNSLLPVNFPYNADQTTSGVVTWEVTGLLAKGPVKSVGTFTLKRVFNAAALEE